jgi:hypothetical protein
MLMNFVKMLWYIENEPCIDNDSELEWSIELDINSTPPLLAQVESVYGVSRYLYDLYGKKVT